MNGNRGLYIQLFSIHGLIRAANIELGRDADTGGQVKYVLELAAALSQRDDVRKVDLFTRLIRDKTVSPDYAEAVDEVNEKFRIVRIQCGGTRYIKKELLWRHLDEFVDKTLKFVKDEGELPDLVHGHYADAGYVAMELSRLWGVPYAYTGHSLGRVKKLDLEAGGMQPEEMNRRYRIDHRIEVEEDVIRKAEFIVTATNQEVEKQYGHYQAAANATFCVIPPGIDLGRFYPFYNDPPADEDSREKIKQAEFFVQKELERFLTYPGKPIILALSRPDHRKNIPALVKAFGIDKELQAIANLAVFAGIRKDITAMDDNEQAVLTELLLLMDKYDLYGKLAIPKRHDVEYEVPVLYRKAARHMGVFVNPAFKENFGLTLIEAAASGLPIVATDDGGPRDIIGNCENGILVDVSNTDEISAAIKKILVNEELWKTYSQNGISGIREHYSWTAHCQRYMERARKLVARVQPSLSPAEKTRAIGKRFTRLRKLFITDIDDTLLGDNAALADLIELIERHRNKIGFGVATGRPLRSTREVLQEYGVPAPDVLITSVGTEIYYGRNLLADNGWHAHISEHWKPEKIREVLAELPFLEMQEDEAQRDFKLSYYMEDSPEYLAQVHQILTQNRLRYNLIYSNSAFLDILPYRASKGKAVRYLSYKWNFPLRHILVAGDSENDEDMLRGELQGVVVSNHHANLEKLKGLQHVYFSPHAFAAGIIDGFSHYKFLPQSRKRKQKRVPKQQVAAK